MKKSTEIKTELDRTTKRLDELTEMRAGVAGNLKTLQSGFVGGKTSLDELQAEQSKLTTLNDSIKALEAKQGELHAAFQKASLSESRQSLLESAKATALEAEPLFNEYLSIRAELNEVLAGYASRLIEKLGNYRNKQEQYASIVRQLEPQLTNLNQINPENRLLYTQIKNELESLGLDPATIEAITHKSFAAADLEFGAAVTAAEGILFNKLTQEAQAAEKKQFNERRMRNFEGLPTARMPETEKAITYSQS